jgi:hypothetical protein
MIYNSDMICRKCGKRITTQELASYGERCEDCYCGGKPVTTNGLSAAVRNGVHPTMGRGKHAKTSRNSKKTGGGG